MIYALIEDGVVKEYPVYEGEIRLRYGRHADPLVIPDGYEPVCDISRPEVDYTKKAIETTPELVDGKWTRTWIVQDCTEEEINEIVMNIGNFERQKRNQLLSLCDWTQLPDVNIDKERWVEYRQALRDVTNQEGFPWQIEWPESPGSVLT